MLSSLLSDYSGYQEHWYQNCSGHLFLTVNLKQWIFGLLFPKPIVKKVVDFVHLDFDDKILRGSKYSTRPFRSSGAKILEKLMGYMQGLETRTWIKQKTQSKFQKTVWKTVEVEQVKKLLLCVRVKKMKGLILKTRIKSFVLI